MRGRAVCERRCDRRRKGVKADGIKIVDTDGLRRIGGRPVGFVSSCGDHRLVVILKGR